MEKKLIKVKSNATGKTYYLEIAMNITNNQELHYDIKLTDDDDKVLIAFDDDNDLFPYQYRTDIIYSVKKTITDYEASLQQIEQSEKEIVDMLNATSRAKAITEITFFV